MIKFLIVTVFIILFFRLVAPTLFRWLLTMFIKKKMRNGGFFTNMQQPQNQNYNSQHNHAKPDGKVKIDYIPEQPDRKNFDGGEYVEYEEVK